MSLPELRTWARRLGLDADVGRQKIVKSITKSASAERTMKIEEQISDEPVVVHDGADARLNTAKGGRATLVVCPTSVLSNWVSQAKQHLAGTKLKVVLYHGAKRAELTGEEDVVVTTYGTLSAEYDALDDTAKVGKKRKSTSAGGLLLSTVWHRVVLDEAHSIRNSQTKAFKACCSLKTEHRWAVTGTPMQNRVEDFHSLVAFLRAAPLDNKAVFTQAIGRPVRAGCGDGLARLRVVLRAVCLRRSKALLSSSLPLRTVEVHRIKLDAAHREAYDAIFESARAAYDALLSGGGAEAVLREYSSVLECLLRLRQVCCSLRLLPRDRLERARQILSKIRSQAAAGEGEAAVLNVEEARRLLQKLKGALQSTGDAASVFECAVCLSDLEEGKARVLRTCSHCFCDFCLDRIVNMKHGGKVACPMCRGHFTPSDILKSDQLETAAGAEAEAHVPQPPTGKATNETEEQAAAPKVRALVAALREHWKEDPAQKAVVFSQFTGMLCTIAEELRANQITYGRLDGSMSHEQREKHIAEFQAETGGPQVILVSLKAGGAGVNLVRANLVFMMDLWWNAGVEEQAMDRVHRIGQTRAVTVVRFVCDGTVEERMLQLQEGKRLLGQAAMTRLSQDELRQARVTQLTSIFSRN